MLKFVAFVCLIISVLGNDPAKPANGVTQNFIEGERVAGDKQIWSGSGNQVTDADETITIDIPFPWKLFRNKAVISQIVATAMQDSGSTQFTITRGGIGQKHFNLRIVSNDAHKVSYKYQVYGK